MRKDDIRRALCRRFYSLVSSMEQKARHCWAQAPLTESPRAPDSEYARRFEEAWGREDASLRSYLNDHFPDLSFEEDWFRRIAYLAQTTIKVSPLSFEHGRLVFAELFQIARVQPGETLKIMEIGTARGFSAICMAKALAAAGVAGVIMTVDPIPHEIPLYWNAPGDEEGKRSRVELLQEFKDLLEEYVIFLQGTSDQILSRLSLSRIHFGFLDGVHEYDAVMTELRYFGQRQRVGDVILLDDFNKKDFPGVVRAVEEFCGHNSYEMKVIGEGDRRYAKITREAE